MAQHQHVPCSSVLRQGELTIGLNMMIKRFVALILLTLILDARVVLGDSSYQYINIPEGWEIYAAEGTSNTPCYLNEPTTTGGEICYGKNTLYLTSGDKEFKLKNTPDTDNKTFEIAYTIDTDQKNPLIENIAAMPYNTKYCTNSNITTASYFNYSDDQLCQIVFIDRYVFTFNLSTTDDASDCKGENDMCIYDEDSLVVKSSHAITLTYTETASQTYTIGNDTDQSKYGSFTITAYGGGTATFASITDGQNVTATSGDCGSNPFGVENGDGIFYNLLVNDSGDNQPCRLTVTGAPPTTTQAFNYTLLSNTGTITSEDSIEDSSVCVVPSEGLSEGSSACADPSAGCSVNGTGDTQTLNYNNCGDATSPDTYTISWEADYQANISYPNDMPPTVTNDDDCIFTDNTDGTGILTVTEDSTCNIVINNSDYGDGMPPCPITLTGSTQSNSDSEQSTCNVTIHPQNCGSLLSSDILLKACRLTVSYFGQTQASEQPCGNVTASTPKDLINKLTDGVSCGNAWPEAIDPPCQ